MLPRFAFTAALLAAMGLASARADVVTWTNGSLTSTWDVGASQNWTPDLGGRDDGYFANGDAVTFGGLRAGTVDIQFFGVAPASTLFSHTFDTYTLTGGPVSGGTLTVNGFGGTTVFDNTTNGFSSIALSDGTLQLVDRNFNANATIGGAGTMTLSGGILQLRSAGIGTGTGNVGTTTAETVVFGNNVVVAGDVEINVARPASGSGGSATTKTLQLGNLSIGAGTLSVTGANSFALRFDGTTTLTGDAVFNVTTANLTLNGALSGSGFDLTKQGAGQLLYNSVAAPDHADTVVSGGTLQWNYSPASGNNVVSFGTGTIAIDNGATFTFAAGGAASNSTQTITNAFTIGSGGGRIGSSSSTGKTFRFTGDIAMAGTLGVGVLGGGGGGTPGSEFAGAITVDQTATAARRIILYSGGNHGPTISGVIQDGPGGTGNVLRLVTNDTSNGRDVTLSGANTYAGGTILESSGPVAWTAGRYINVAATGTLGTGDVTMESGTLLRLADAANLAPGKKIAITQSGNAFTGVGLAFDVDPAAIIDAANSTGGFFVGIDGPNTTANINLATITQSGNVVLGATSGKTGTFSGTVTPTAGGLYRVGYGGGTLILSGENALSGANDVQIGGYFGNLNASHNGGTLTLAAANNIVGNFTVSAGQSSTGAASALAARASGAFGSTAQNTITLNSSSNNSPRLRFETADQSHDENVTVAGSSTAFITANTIATLSGTLSTGTANVTFDGTGALVLAGGANAGSGSLTVANGGALALGNVNQLSTGNLNLSGGILLLGGIAWSDFAANRSAGYGAGAGQWQLTNNGGFAARGTVQQITSGNFDQNFQLGADAVYAAGNFYADAPVDVAVDTTLTAARTIRLAVTASVLNDSYATAGSYTIANRFSGDIGGTGHYLFNVKTANGNDAYAAELVLAGTNNNWTGEPKATASGYQLDTGSGGMLIGGLGNSGQATAPTLWIRFASPQALPKGAGSSGAFLAVERNGGNNPPSTSKYGAGYLFTGSTSANPVYDLGNYSLWIGVVNTSFQHSGSFGMSSDNAADAATGASLATLKGPVLLHTSSATGSQTGGLVVRDGTFFLGQAGTGNELVFRATANPAAGTTGPTNYSAADTTTGSRTLIKMGTGTAVLGNVLYRATGNSGGGPVDAGDYAGRFFWQIGRGATDGNSHPLFFEGAVRGRAGNASATGDGAVPATSANSLEGFAVQLRGGVYEIDASPAGDAFSAVFSRGLGTAATDVGWGNGGGGFSAFGGPVDVALTTAEASREWQDTNFIPAGQPLVFGSYTADNVVNWTVSLPLANASNATVNREIRVIDNPNSAGDLARISGNIVNRAAGQTVGTGARSITKTGSGTLVLAGAANDYNGTTTVSAGTLSIAGALTATASAEVAAGATLELAGAGGSALPEALLVTNHGAIAVVTAAQQLGRIEGAGDTVVAASAALTADSIVQDTLAIGPGGSVTIREVSLAAAAQAGASAVPEPSAIALLLTALGCGLWLLRRRR